MIMNLNLKKWFLFFLKIELLFYDIKSYVV